MQTFSPLSPSFSTPYPQREILHLTLGKKANQFNLSMTLPTLLEQVISSKVGMSEAAEAIAKGGIFDGFTNAIFSLEDGVCQASFEFEGHKYILENSHDENENRILQVKNCIGQVLAKFENSSLEQLRSRLILLSTFVQLDPDARVAFQPLFDIQKIGHVGAKTPLVSGDLDGSMARLLVLGIQAGKINIDPESCEILAWLINKEALVLAQLNAFPHSSYLRNFQSNAKAQEAIRLLATRLTYQKGHTDLILIGDVLYDRFSCDIRASLLISSMMSRNEAKFITGNHDTLILSKWGDPESEEFDMPVAVSFGGFASYDISDKECSEFQQKIFSNAYYHKQTNKLYLHHGLEEKDGRIYTAFGGDSYPLPKDGKAFDVEKFVQWVNRQPRPLPRSLITDPARSDENYALDNRLSGFRPDDEAMSALARKMGVEIVHGHSGNMDASSSDVIVLNARREGLLAVVAAYIGNSDAPIKCENLDDNKRARSNSLANGQLQNREKRRRIELASNEALVEIDRK